MSTFDPRAALDQLFAEYNKRANSIRRDLGLPHQADFAEQAQERQNDEVLEALLAEAEAGLRQVGLARQRLDEGLYGDCQRCGEPINPARLADCRVLPGLCGKTAHLMPCQQRQGGARMSPSSRGVAPPDKDFRCPNPSLLACTWRLMT